MSERLSPLDVSFLYLEEPDTAMHVGSVMIFQTPEHGLDFEHLVRHVAARIAFVPRYRQRVRPIPGRLANPVWVDDEHFDIRHHVHRAALPQPGTDEQLAELVARLQAGALERRRPLWELTVVEGLRDGRFAIVTKVHQAMVDGVQALDLGQVVLDVSPRVPEPPPDTWHPARWSTPSAALARSWSCCAPGSATCGPPWPGRPMPSAGWRWPPGPRPTRRRPARSTSRSPATAATP
jgi:diacylglycerol O-acyltransferase